MANGAVNSKFGKQNVALPKSDIRNWCPFHKDPIVTLF